MSIIPSGEMLTETKICRQCQTSFPITDKDLEFYDKVSPVFNGQKYLVPAPKFCPDCRQQRRLSFRNERKLYKRNCDATGKEIISIYSPDKNLKVYHQDEWWSDKWDPMEYGLDMDLTQSFFKKYAELYTKVPKLQNMATQNENSLYVNGAAYNKNCYLIFASDYNEETSYCDNVSHSVCVTDSSDSNSCEYSYYVIGCKNCSKSQHCIECYNSSFLEYCFDCHGCTNCFLST